jgi:hypothetical protein
MELYEEAVNLALEVDLKLAKTNANQPDDDDLRKKLWLLIARHTIDSGGDIKDAIEILKDCTLLKVRTRYACTRYVRTRYVRTRCRSISLQFLCHLI